MVPLYVDSALSACRCPSDGMAAAELWVARGCATGTSGRSTPLVVGAVMAPSYRPKQMDSR